LVFTYFTLLKTVGMVIGFMPMTGIPLPFMSYGGSSIMAAFTAMAWRSAFAARRFVN
jgi:rod shape determining protein RodA